MISAMSATAIRSDWVGQVIDGRFTLLQWLGGSARSGVFLTELPGPQGRKGAIKLTFEESEKDIETHMAGWAATRPLTHPHLMRLLHTGRCEMGGGTLLYSVSEYAEEVLSEILPERALTPDEAREMLVPIVDTLSYLHGKGLVHGHLKPANILVVDDKLKLSGDSLKVAGSAGEPASRLSIYDAPERAHGVVSFDGDVWSLGVTLVEALTQKTPEWDKARGADPVVPQGIPQPLAGIARGCLRADPMERSHLGNVKDWLEGKPVSGRSGEKAGAKFPVTATVAAVLVVAAVVGVIAVRSHKSEAPVAGTQLQSAPVVAAQPMQAQESTNPAAPAAEVQGQDQAAPVATPEAAPQASTPVQAPVQAPAAAQEKAAQTTGSAAVGALAAGGVLERVEPDVLPKAMVSIHGKFDVRIRVTVDGAGNVVGAAFASEGPSPYFGNAAMKAVRQWKFKPGQAGDAVVQYRFTRDGADASIEGGN